MSGKEIWVYLERDDDHFEDVSLEILGEARKLASKANEKVVAIILGSDPLDYSDTAIKYGADRVLFVKHDLLENYGTEAYTKSLSDLVKERRPNIFLVGASLNGRDLAARLAARLRTGLAANVVSLGIGEDGTLYSGVPGYGSKIIAQIVCVKNLPQMSTVRAGIFEKSKFDPQRKGEVEVIAPSLEETKNRVSVISRLQRQSKDISKSEKVVVAGNGVSMDVDMVDKFAKLMNADVGATRPMADRGIFPREIQIGSTGIALNSKIVVVLGSSGADHFVTGITNCKTIISVDIDPKSNIFDYSDYCVVGDASKILPELIKSMEGRKK